jgi:hypothetical protein
MKKLLLALPVVLLLAAGCSSNQPVAVNQPNSTQPTQTQQTTPQSTTTQTTPTPTQTDDYLVIKEWGVKFKKPAGMSDLKYVLGASNANGGTISFSTLKLENLDKQLSTGKLYCSAANDPIGHLSRANSLPSKDPNDKPYPTNLKIDSYYYWFDGPQATCSDNQQVKDLESSQIKPLEAALSKLEAVK